MTAYLLRPSFGGRTNYWDEFPDSFTLVAALAEATEKITLYASFGTLATPPVLTAKMANTLSEIGGGRIGVNLVTGWIKKEYEMMGLWPGGSHFGDRYDRATEYVQIMRELWTSGHSDFKGNYYEMDDCVLTPLPKHPIPIVCAGGSPRGLRFTSEMADVAFIGPPSWEVLDTQLKTLDEGRRASGREVSAYVTSTVIIEDTDEEAEETVRRIREGLDIEAVANAVGAAKSDPNPTKGSVSDSISDSPNIAFMNNMPIYGSPPTVAAQVDRIARAGSGSTVPEAFMISFADYLGGSERFAREVIPLLQS